MTAIITGQLPNVPKINSVKYLPHSFCFNHLSNTESTPNQPSKIANTYFFCNHWSIKKYYQKQLSKYLTYSVCFNHWSITECIPNQLSKIYDT